MSLNFYKVLSLPAELQPDSFYYVENGNLVDGYLTDNLGVAKQISSPSGATDGLIETVGDITARDALVLDKNALIFVVDASADVNVDSGSALYFYDEGLDMFTLVVEKDHFSGSYNDLTDKPTIPSATVVVDDLVTNQATHALSAAQGVVLKGYIDALNTLVSSDEITLDTLQEIVDFIQINRATLDTLGINNIAGLQAALDSKATAAQGALADSALQPGANISSLTNDSGFVTENTQLSDAEVETAYGNQVPVVTQAEAEAGVVTDVRRWTPTRVAQAIAALASGGGVDWATVQTSDQVDGASNTAFDFNTSNLFALGKLLRIRNNSGSWLDATRYKISFTGQYGVLGIESYLIRTTHSNFQLGSNNQTQLLMGSSNNVYGSPTQTSHQLSYANSGSTVLHPQDTPTATSLTIRSANTTVANFAPSTLKIKAGNAHASSTTNQDGGDLILEGGDSASGGGVVGNIVLSNLPTSDPVQVGALWNDSGTVKISAG